MGPKYPSRTPWYGPHTDRVDRVERAVLGQTLLPPPGAAVGDAGRAVVACDGCGATFDTPPVSK